MSDDSSQSSIQEFSAAGKEDISFIKGDVLSELTTSRNKQISEEIVDGW